MPIGRNFVVLLEAIAVAFGNMLDRVVVGVAIGVGIFGCHNCIIVFISEFAIGTTVAFYAPTAASFEFSYGNLWTVLGIISAASAFPHCNWLFGSSIAIIVIWIGFIAVDVGCIFETIAFSLVPIVAFFVDMI